MRKEIILMGLLTLINLNQNVRASNSDYLISDELSPYNSPNFNDLRNANPCLNNRVGKSKMVPLTTHDKEWVDAQDLNGIFLGRQLKIEP